MNVEIPYYPTQQSMFSPKCPRCGSDHIDSKNTARKAGGTIGLIAGAPAGASTALVGAETGALIGAVAGPVGIAMGGVIGAILGGFAGASLGCTSGAKVGELIDRNVLDNFHCLTCRHVFNISSN
jgi:hypothetical protein